MWAPGIGAYLVRLGQRAIQIEGQPIILTGAPALNSLLGREVYTSSLQLGGPQIMHKNGVSHMVAADDFAGVTKIVEWMSFVPDRRNGPVPITLSTDTWDREVVYTPPVKQQYDVRWMIQGKDDEEGFQPGLFDRDSFVETLDGWAKTVVVGRARLGGIPMGVIAVESRTVENVTPADAANPDSIEQVTNEAGGVWYPNSAFKTAQAINDFNYGEQLPLMILANWRGFSGGQRDMYNEVLKYGSFIVDALVKYEQPIFVYIPPHGELRGGSWVVVDPTINPACMEMYADAEARGGVLEPEGIIGIKYKKDKLLATMERLDREYAALKKRSKESGLDGEEKASIKQKISVREQKLLPIYTQVAVQFADLHDRAGRMKAKGVVRDQLVWSQARRFFYWRVRRRLNEEHLLKRMAANSAPGGDAPRLNTVAGDALRAKHLQQLMALSGIADFDKADREVAGWYEAHQAKVLERLEMLRREAVGEGLRELLITGGATAEDSASEAEVETKVSSGRQAAWKGVREVLRTMPVEEREKALKFLSE
jgi:acetyl-CoA carboxylase / biotin carboxylase 1